jgi:site-specific DNA recombinase
MGGMARGALEQLDPVWNEMFSAEQARVVQLLVEQVDIAADGVDITLRAAGMATLVAELQTIVVEQRRVA